MGVPKFFRWISERYPNLSVNLENNEIPVFDCLYLDMNGIIHVCSHPDDGNVHFRITEEQIFSNVFNYIDFLFKTVKPKEVFFLAVDGVAPRAKMNQQRCRRFKSAKEAKDRDAAAIQNGTILPKEKRFDSNAITPGTEFMDRLQQALRSFLTEKMNCDSLWHGVDVILSGHETPGEGEHKIQEYIRYKRSLQDYNPNTRHCLYGLDADLMLLGLASHEPYFSLLREEVTFTSKSKPKRAYVAEETKFFLLHLSLLRDYIDYEFSTLKPLLGSEYDLERIIDDWIVLSFLVGNDFVPHLPNIHIHTSALPLLWNTYIKTRPLMNGYINCHGKLDIKNLMIYIADLANFDHRHFEDQFEDMKWMFGKRGEQMAKELENLDKIVSDHQMIDKDLIEFDNWSPDEDLVSLDEIDVGKLHIDDGDDIWRMQFNNHKTDYYYTKLGLKYSQEMLVEQAKEYITALQWISYYYFSGVSSWSWFYPQHYAPFVSDLTCINDDDFITAGINFNIGRPFLPFEQLMAVLPSDSAELLPDCFNVLMTLESSPIIDFYPKSFKSDINGKKREWEALVLIPFIDEDRLLQSLQTYKHLLSKEEAKRNIHSNHLLFRFSQKKLTILEIDPTVFRIPRESNVFGLCPNVHLDVICQGFPTFKHIEHTFSHERAFVKVFENNSTFESIVLKITPAVIPPTVESVAMSFLDKLVYVNWPAFFLTKVVAVLDKESRTTLDPITKQLVKTPLPDEDTKKLKEFIASQTYELYKRRAVVMDETNMIVLETLHAEGSKYEIVNFHKAGCTVSLERNWVPHKTHWHLHQLALLQDSIDLLKREEWKACTKLSQLFPVDGIVFCLDSNYYGHCAQIKSINNAKGAIVVKLDTLKEPDYGEIDVNATGEEYMTAAKVSEYLGIDALMIAKITGSIFLNIAKSGDLKGKKRSGKKERHSIGLDLKNNKLNLQVPGWVFKIGGDNGTAKWMYSMRVVKVLDNYRDNFPEIFEFFKKPNFESLSVEEAFGIEGDMELLERKWDGLRKYLDGLEYRTIERLSNDHVMLAVSQILKLEELMNNIDEHAYNVRVEAPIEVELDFKSLYRPHHSLHGTKPDMGTEYRLLDRVVCSTEGYTVPLGCRGVVIGIEPPVTDQIKLEILFDHEFKSAISIRGSQPRCYRMPPYAIINTSHGLRQFNCPCRVVRKTQAKVAYNNSPKSTSNILNELFSTPPAALPPMPSRQFSANVTGKSSSNISANVCSNHKNDEKKKTKNNAYSNDKQMNFLAHCDKLFQSSSSSPSSKAFTNIIGIYNCPTEYTTLFNMCLKCGVYDPTVHERHVNGDIFMSFSCSSLHIPEHKETSLIQGRQNHAHRIWQCLYSDQQQQRYAPRHQQLHDTPCATLHTNPVPAKQTRRTKSFSGETQAVKTDKSSGNKVKKKFIQAPKPKITFPKDE